MLVYYRIYAEDGAIPSKTLAAPGDPFLGRIKALSVPPPHTAETVKRCIAKMEKINDLTNISLFLTPNSQSPMDNADKVTVLNRSGPGSTSQEPLALVAKMSDSGERSALESGGRDELASAADSDPEIRYRTSIQHSATFLFVTSQLLREVYYQLYGRCEMPSKVSFDPEEPSLGRIRADWVAPPHSPTSIIRCISKVERTPFAQAYLYADISCDAPLKEGHISILRTDGPGLSPNEPMVIVVQVERPIPDGKYLIKNRAADIYWDAYGMPSTVCFRHDTIYRANFANNFHVSEHSPIIQVFKG